MKSQIIEHLIGGVEAARRQFEPSTGRFLAENGGWAVTQQDVIYPLALLYATEHPANPYHRDAQILDMASRGGDALRDWQDEEGRVEFIKTDGSRWGKIYMPWSMYHWLEAFALLKEHLTPARAKSWETGLRLAFSGSAKEQEKMEKVHNIPTWHCMALVRAAEVFGEPRWREIGERGVRRAADSQTPDGYWAEGQGPTTSYNLVYVHAIGLYHRFTGDAHVLPSLERALDFHLRFTYPDGSPVETIDGRCRYHEGPSEMGLPGFAIRPDGRRFVRFLMSRIRVHKPKGALSPHLASAFVHCSEGAESPIPQEQHQFATVHGGHALIRKQGPWFYSLSGYTIPTEALGSTWRERWRLARQNLLSVWHERTGLLIGGGNSKHQPEFSTFSMLEGRVEWLQPCEATPRLDDVGGDTLDLRYGNCRCCVRVKIISPEALEISFEPPASGSAQGVVAGFTMKLKAGAKVWSGTDDSVVLNPHQPAGLGFSPDCADEKRWIAGEGWRLEMPPESRFSWPYYPLNPYAINYAAPPEQAVARVEVGFLESNKAKIFRLKVEKA